MYPFPRWPWTYETVDLSDLTAGYPYYQTPRATSVAPEVCDMLTARFWDLDISAEFGSWDRQFDVAIEVGTRHENDSDVTTVLGTPFASERELFESGWIAYIPPSGGGTPEFNYAVNARFTGADDVSEGGNPMRYAYDFSFRLLRPMLILDAGPPEAVGWGFDFELQMSVVKTDLDLEEVVGTWYNGESGVSNGGLIYDGQTYNTIPTGFTCELTKGIPF